MNNVTLTMHHSFGYVMIEFRPKTRDFELAVNFDGDEFVDNDKLSWTDKNFIVLTSDTEKTVHVFDEDGFESDVSLNDVELEWCKDCVCVAQYKELIGEGTF